MMLETRNDNIYSFRTISASLGFVVECLLVFVNIFPIVVVLKTKTPKKRVVTDKLVLALSITDILATVLPTPIAIVSYTKTGWYNLTCVFFQLTTIGFRCVSVLIVTYMCTDRVMVLRQILLYKITRIYSAHRASVVIFILYTVSFLISLIPVSEFIQPSLFAPRNSCESAIVKKRNTYTEDVFCWILLGVGFTNILTVSILSFKVVSMVCKLKKKMRPIGPPRNKIPELQIERKCVFEYCWMTLAVTGLFYFTWCPVLIMLTLQQSGINISIVAISYAFFSNKLAGLLNPLIYGLFSKSYRRGYKSILHSATRLCRCKEQEFQPVPAISWENHLQAVEDMEDIRAAGTSLPKSVSYHDKPVRGGFQNYALDSSIHSELCGYSDNDRFRRTHSDFRSANNKRRKSEPCTSGTMQLDSHLPQEMSSDSFSSDTDLDGQPSDNGNDSDHSDSDIENEEERTTTNDSIKPTTETKV